MKRIGEIAMSRNQLRVPGRRLPFFELPDLGRRVHQPRGTGTPRRRGSGRAAGAASEARSQAPSLSCDCTFANECSDRDSGAPCFTGGRRAMIAPHARPPRPFLDSTDRRCLRSPGGLRHVNGGYIASPYSGEAGYDRYDVYWLRDIMYATYANEYLGLYEKVKQSWPAWCSPSSRSSTPQDRPRHPPRQGEPDLQRARRARSCTCARAPDPRRRDHRRVGPSPARHLRSLPLQDRRSHEARLQRHPHRRATCRSGACIPSATCGPRAGLEPDFGVWEEGPELHASSIGSTLAGLTMWHDHGFYDYKYKNRIDVASIIPVSERFLEDGNAALAQLLPRESASRPYDPRAALRCSGLTTSSRTSASCRSRSCTTSSATSCARAGGAPPGDVYF